MIDDILGLCGSIVAEKYEVAEAVGKGGFAVVYRAQHLLWQRPVALKVFRALEGGAAGDSKALTDDLVREASLLAELSETTASICQARDVGTLVTPGGQSLPYMVLEWLEGTTLAETLQGESKANLPARSLTASVALLEPVAEALAVAHSRGIAHRDVKPANVFLAVDRDGKPLAVKLLDFGIAKVVQDAQKTGGAFHKTAGLVTAFTPSYGAPEQFSRKFGATGPWTDVFSLALVLVECATGRRVAATGDFIELAKVAIDTARRPSPRTLGLAVSDATEAVFARALAVQPEQRYPTAGSFWAALSKTLGVEPSRTIVAAAAASEHDLFAGIAHAHTAPAPPDVPSTPSLGPPARVSLAPAAAAPRASGKRVLAVGAVAGVLFTTAMFVALRLDRGNSSPPPGSVDPAASEPVAASGPPRAPAPAPVASASATHGRPARCPDGMTLIPRGEFFMGVDDATEGEKPAHHVELSPYCIDLYEVTTARYAACSDTGKCKRAWKTNDWPGITAEDHGGYDALCSGGAAATDPTAPTDHPVVCVDWEMASTYCKTTPGGRLPSEAEWEFAARGPDGRTYPWGDEAPSERTLNACGKECVAWAKHAKVTLTAMYAGDDAWPNTAPVGSFPAGRSRFGLYDVAGNVWEWVADWHGPYGKAPEVDPKGPAEGKARVIRGGAWNGGAASWVRPTFRFMSGPESRSYGIGFRCAATPSG